MGVCADGAKGLVEDGAAGGPEVLQALQRRLLSRPRPAAPAFEVALVDSTAAGMIRGTSFGRQVHGLNLLHGGRQAQSAADAGLCSKQITVTNVQGARIHGRAEVSTILEAWTDLWQRWQRRGCAGRQWALSDLV